MTKITARTESFKLTEELFKITDQKIIVEIGSIRDESYRHKCGDGHSTLLWQRISNEVYSVDVDEAATEITERLTDENVNVINQDGIEFLRNFDKKIDLLYLDGWDCGTDQCKENHLEAYRTARPKMSEKSLILIDDCMCKYNFLKPSLLVAMAAAEGKGELVVPEAIKDGFVVERIGYQVLLSKGI